MLYDVLRHYFLIILFILVIIFTLSSAPPTALTGRFQISFSMTQPARKASITNKHQELREGKISPLVFQKVVTSTTSYVWATRLSSATHDCQELDSM